MFRRPGPGESREPDLWHPTSGAEGGRTAFFAAAGLVLSLMLLRRRFVPAYLLNFVVGGVFGKLLDRHMTVVSCLEAYA